MLTVSGGNDVQGQCECPGLLAALAMTALGVKVSCGDGPRMRAVLTFPQHQSARDALHLAPFLQQHLAPARIARLDRRQLEDPVGAEMAEALAQLAPRHHHADLVEEAEREGPDHAPGLRPLRPAIGDGQLVLGPDRPAHRGEVDAAAGDRLAGPDQQGIGVEALAQIVRQHRRDLGQGVAGGVAQPVVGALRDPARAQHQRLDLVLREHQRRQHEAGPQHIAQPRLALDVGALRLQRGDVAVQGAQADPGLGRQRRAR